MRFTETIEWLICDVCGDYQTPGTSATVGWLEVMTEALGIPSTLKVRHLCHVCRKDFDNFWGE